MLEKQIMPTRNYSLEKLALTAAVAALATWATGCTTDVPEQPYVTFAPKDGPLPEYDDAIDIWSSLGFRAAPPEGTPPCEHNWYDIDQTECTIRVSLERGDLSYFGIWGFTIREEGLVMIHSKLVGDELTFAVAHELGHVLLDSGEHLMGDERGIMSGVTTLRLSDDDRALACRVRGFCY